MKFNEVNLTVTDLFITLSRRNAFIFTSETLNSFSNDFCRDNRQHIYLLMQRMHTVYTARAHREQPKDKTKQKEFLKDFTIVSRQVTHHRCCLLPCKSAHLQSMLMTIARPDHFPENISCTRQRFQFYDLILSRKRPTVLQLFLFNRKQWS